MKNKQSDSCALAYSINSKHKLYTVLLQFYVDHDLRIDNVVRNNRVINKRADLHMDDIKLCKPNPLTPGSDHNKKRIYSKNQFIMSSHAHGQIQSYRV